MIVIFPSDRTKADSLNSDNIVSIEATGELRHEVDPSYMSMQWNFTRKADQEGVVCESNSFSKSEHFCECVEVNQNGNTMCPPGKGSATFIMSASIAQAPASKVSPVGFAGVDLPSLLS